jgi:hypothetical protein
MEHQDRRTDDAGAPAGSADAYERQFMAGADAVLHRERTVWKLHWILLFGPLVTLVVAAMGFAGVGTKPMPIPVAVAMLPLAAVLVGLWALFISLRTTVTSREVIVQYGLFGPHIPLDGIVSCEVRDYPMLALGGGIKRVDGAWAYTLWGQGTRVVRIEWRDPGGGEHATIVSSPDPDKLAASILQARGAARTGARGKAGARVEVETPAEQLGEDEESDGAEGKAKRRA